MVQHVAAGGEAEARGQARGAEGRGQAGVAEGRGKAGGAEGRGESEQHLAAGRAEAGVRQGGQRAGMKRVMAGTCRDEACDGRQVALCHAPYASSSPSLT